MSLDKAIEHGKEFRKPYRKSKRFDRTCRPGRSFVNKCSYCEANRFVGDARLEEKVQDELKNDTPITPVWWHDVVAWMDDEMNECGPDWWDDDDEEYV